MSRSTSTPRRVLRTTLIGAVVAVVATLSASTAAQSLGTSNLAAAGVPVAGVATRPAAATTAPAALPVTPAVAKAQGILRRGGVPELQRLLKAALHKKAYPAHLEPGIRKAPTGEVKYLLPQAQCIQADNIYATDQCNFGPSDAPKTAVVIGDSISVSYLPGLIRALVPQGYKIHAMALAGCPVADVEMNLAYDPDASDKCNQGHQQIYLQVQRLHPDLVIMANSASDIMRLASGNRGSAAIAEWEKGYTTAMRAMYFPGRKFVQISANPTGPDPDACVIGLHNKLNAPSACQGFVQTWYDWMKTAESTVLKKFDGTYVDARGWYCHAGQCPEFAMGLSMRWDMSHITESYSEALTPLLQKAVLGTD